MVNSTPKYIAVSVKEGMKVLSVDKIVYLQSSGRYTSIHLVDKTSIAVCKNLGHFDKLFESLYFIRVHNSFLINVDYLESIVKDGGGQYCLLNKKIMIPISNRKLSYVKEYLHY